MTFRSGADRPPRTPPAADVFRIAKRLQHDGSALDDGATGASPDATRPPSWSGPWDPLDYLPLEPFRRDW